MHFLLKVLGLFEKTKVTDAGNKRTNQSPLDAHFIYYLGYNSTKGESISKLKASMPALNNQTDTLKKIKVSLSPGFLMIWRLITIINSDIIKVKETMVVPKVIPPIES